MPQANDVSTANTDVDEERFVVLSSEGDLSGMLFERHGALDTVPVRSKHTLLCMSNKRRFDQGEKAVC